MFKPAIFLIGWVGFTFLVMLVFYSAFLSNTTETWVGWLVLAGAVIIGAFVGLLLAKLTKLGVAVLGAWGGACLGLVLWSAFLYKINSQVVFYIFLVLFAIIFASLSLCLFDHALIISTSFVGAYAFVRGISMYAGGYPNEFTLVEMIQKGLLVVEPAFYAYFAGIIVAFIIGLVVQYKSRSKNEVDTRHPYYNLR